VVVSVPQTTTTGSLVLLRSTGAGFAASTLATGTLTRSIAIGDVNGDGRPDVLIPVDSIPNQSFVDVYLTQATGGLTKSAHVSLQARASTLLLGDLTGDGRTDVITLDTSSRLSLLGGDGAGSFSFVTSFYGPPDAIDLAVGDIDANGQPELVVGAPGGINAYDRSGSFFGGSPHLVSSSSWPELRALADVDGDGKLDLVMSGLFNGGLAFQPSQGGYSFAAPATVGGVVTIDAVAPLQLGALPRRWLVVSGDGLHDWQETASGVTDTPVGGPTGNRILRVDWNHDGIEDVIVAGAVLGLYRGNADGTYTFTGTTLLGGGYANAVDFFDATGDGRKDLVVVNHYGGITVLPGTP
jgi:hypothetical protein